MKRTFLLVAVVVAATTVHAGGPLWDSTSISTGQTSRPAGGSMPAGHWTNTNALAINLTSVAFLGDPGADTNVKYVFANGAGVVVDIVTVAHTDVGLGLYAATVNWTVGAGDSFYIASMHDTGTGLYGFRTPAGTSQNGIVGLNNGNFQNYANPTFQGDAGAEMSWQLNGAPVPEPATMTALALGAVALLRRKRKA